MDRKMLPRVNLPRLRAACIRRRFHRRRGPADPKFSRRLRTRRRLRRIRLGSESWATARSAALRAARFARLGDDAFDGRRPFPLPLDIPPERED